MTFGTRGRRGRLLAGALFCLTLIWGGRPAAALPDIKQLTASGIKTLQLDSEIVTENQTELKKISGDIALAYRVHRGSMIYAQPGNLHVETTVLGRHISYTISGNRKITDAPFYHRIEDVATAPGKKQSLLDFGLVPPEYLNEYNALFLRRENGLYVYQLMPKQKGETQKDFVWIDPATRITVRRQNYDRDGKLTKWFLYKNPLQVGPGLFVPTRVEMYNPENRLAGVTVYQNVRANRAVDMSVFRF